MARLNNHSIYKDGKHMGFFRAVDEMAAIRDMLEELGYESDQEAADEAGVTVEEMLSQFKVIDVDGIDISNPDFSITVHYKPEMSLNECVGHVMGTFTIEDYTGQWQATVNSPEWIEVVFSSNGTDGADNDPEADVRGEEVIAVHRNSIRELVTKFINDKWDLDAFEEEHEEEDEDEYGYDFV